MGIVSLTMRLLKLVKISYNMDQLLKHLPTTKNKLEALPATDLVLSRKKGWEIINLKVKNRQLNSKWFLSFKQNINGA